MPGVKNDKTTHKPIFNPPFLVLALMVAGAIVWFAFIRPHKASTTLKKADKKTTASTTTQTPLHTSDEAVKTAVELYTYYLPHKIETTAKVGDSQYMEPAAVQLVRASKDYFTKTLYSKILADYMSEYQSTGKVATDEVTCVTNLTDKSTSDLGSISKDSVIVNVSITLTDGSIKKVPVTIDLHALEISKIDCNT